ncbi:hypothetical protein CIK05_00080 [Bdellovibrio sp. qaytius]|nr:hypothetical protein CIK05_00080 [Bdellovibrio sp. qaytius]
MNKLRGLVLGFIIWVIYKSLSMTWKIKIIEPDSMKAMIKEKKPFILAHFHGDELALISLASRYKIATMTSTSKDGEMMNTVLRLLGAKTSRGSSTRGGISALKGLLQYCKNGSNCSMAVDGPKGPIYEVKPGVFEISRLMKAPIFAGALTCDRAWHFPKSWNKTYLPKPFAQLTVLWLEFNFTIDKSTDPRSPELADSLKNQIFDARSQSAKLT